MSNPTYRRGFIFEQSGTYTVEIVETTRYRGGCSRRRRTRYMGTPQLKALPLAEEMQSTILTLYQGGGTIE